MTHDQAALVECARRIYPDEELPTDAVSAEERRAICGNVLRRKVTARQAAVIGALIGSEQQFVPYHILQAVIKCKLHVVPVKETISSLNAHTQKILPEHERFFIKFFPPRTKVVAGRRTMQSAPNDQVFFYVTRHK